jgi:hypothetical protein
MEVEDWAFYLDGTEAGSVIVDQKNVNQTLDVDKIYFVRFGLQETAGESSKNTAPQLQYNYESAGFVNVDATSAVVQSIASEAAINDGDDTTQRITAFTFDGTNQGFDEVDGVAGGGDADLVSNGLEALFAFQIIGTEVSHAETIVLKIVNANDADADYDSYTQTDPTITINKASPTTPQAVGGHAMTITGTLARVLTAYRAVGGSSMAIAGNLGTVTTFFKTVGGHAMTITGTLATATICLQTVGQAAVTITGSLVKKISIYIGNGIVSPIGSLSRKTSVFIGKATMTITGSLTTATIFLQSVGSGAVSIAGTLGKIPTYVVNTGSYAMTITGSLVKKTSIFVGKAAMSITGTLGRRLISVGGTIKRGLDRLGMGLDL